MAEPSVDGPTPRDRADAAREQRRERSDVQRESTRERMDAARESTRERLDAARETTRERLDVAREVTAERVEQARLTFRRLVGLDRSGPPPPQTLRGQPWHVWTLPNAIGFARLAVLPVFLVLALSSDHGTDALPAVLFALVAWSDYADGVAARLTGQYSRFGALLDPVVDRLLVVCGLVVCWNFDLLPHAAIALLVARELFMLVAGQIALRLEVDLQINWVGRAAVWPTMTAIMAGLVGVPDAAEVLIYLGLALSWIATVLYLQEGFDQLRARGVSSSA
ncbi:MAG: CDP-alcohol phosphatidyltransferase family protein [Actinomycetota bacterium]|nr:CDP-alcohol phosphatidyltransferase family protein [Actinomycetota bacterium]